MRKQYQKALKICFHSSLVRTRTALSFTQSQMAERLAMDDRSYSDLDRGRSSCGAITLALFLIYCCGDPLGFLGELKHAFEAENDDVV